MKNKVFSKINIIRAALLLGAAILIVLILPRPGRQSYSYELHQPWKYPLLTAPFDMPILRDSMTIKALRDSIDKNFVPFIKRDIDISRDNLSRFKMAIHGNIPAADEAVVTGALATAYNMGIMDSELFDRIHRNGNTTLRTTTGSDSLSNTATTISATAVLSPVKAFAFIDSTYHATMGLAPDAHNPLISKALNACIAPNVSLDSATDAKFRTQEYLNVSAAQGIIKQGQRIVDRGEIITPQIYTNLQTYSELLSQQQDNNILQSYFAIGQFLFIIIVLSMLYFFLHCYRSRLFADIRKMVFLMTYITLFTIFAIILFESIGYGIYIVPFAAVPVIILVFADSRTAIFAHISTVMICSLIATYQFQFLFIELMAGLTATFSMHQLSSRSQLLRTAIVVFLSNFVTYTIFTLISEGDLADFSWRIIGMFAINSVVLSFAYIFIFIIEKCFGFTSTVTLVELSDINNTVLRKLAENAPGTFQHSMQVSTLAAEAARAIDANTQLVRTGALYHDIGKMESPIFFTENQHGVNPHNGLEPETSARKIISHVTDGLQLAAKYKLPHVIKDFIAEHHGCGVARYFYNTAINASEDGIVDPAPFTYPGPNPRSKETAILMMADAVEAASRSLKEHTRESIDSLVDKIIDTQIKEGLLNNAPISLKNIQTVKETFKKRLGTIYHSRIIYPELHKHPQNPGTDKPEGIAPSTQN